MKKLSILLFFSLIALQNINSQNRVIRGFSEQNSSAETKLEERFDAGLSASNIGNNIKVLSAHPHNIGSIGSKNNADYLLAQYKSWGWDAKLEVFNVLFPTPKTRQLELIYPNSYKALLKEPALKEDGTSGQEGQLPTYNAWSADGDVTGELVFVNYGLPSDYEVLEKMGIDVKGKIAIAKYGRSWRGIKPKVAQEHGMIGCIIYSDPKDDGYVQGEVYPKGPYKNEFGVQRGSVMDMVIYPGDPLTPGVGASEGAVRLDRLKAKNLIKIPVLPISYHDAKPLLEAMDGPVVPSDWAGGLPFTYHIGPGKAKVHLKVAFNWDRVNCYDVVAKMKGSQFPDEWVIRGNHHDAWVNGASDPISGQASMLEEAKSIGALVKSGWKPKRTLVYCSWDGEEPGLLGSTEWVEQHGNELQQKAVVYINSDATGRGFLSAGGSHALEPFADQIAKNVIDPETKVSVYERRKAEAAVNAGSVKAKKDILEKRTLTLDALGSGSDFSAFLQHLAVPTLDFGYGGENGGGEYHSIYDSYDNYIRFKDPGFVYGVTLSQTAGRALLRMSESDVLPFDFRHLYTTINDYTKELIELQQATKENTEVENQLIRSHDYTLAADPLKTFIVPQIKSEVPYLNFSPLQNALENLHKSADSVSVLSNKEIKANVDHEQFNKNLYKAEQQLLISGLPRREWYRHILYAPGFYTGYGVKTLPGIREAIEQRNWTEAQEQINIAATTINNLSEYLMKIIM